MTWWKCMMKNCTLMSSCEGDFFLDDQNEIFQLFLITKRWVNMLLSWWVKYVFHFRDEDWIWKCSANQGELSFFWWLCADWWIVKNWIIRIWENWELIWENWERFWENWERIWEKLEQILENWERIWEKLEQILENWEKI